MSYKAIEIASAVSKWFMENHLDNGQIEIYADYRDEMSVKDAIEICTSDDPEFALYEKLEEWYFEEEIRYRDDIKEKIKEYIESEYDGLSIESEEDAFDDAFNEWIDVRYPVDHYLDQEFQVDIMLDTGDGNYDYTLNSVYPCYYGRYEDRLEEKSSLLWLARQQGYTKTQLWKALRDEDDKYEGFLKSCRVEVENLPSHMATLTFLVTMTLRDLIKLNKGIKLQDRNGVFYDAKVKPYCGYIVVDKDAMTGLFDPWAGGGSVLEIELDKDVRIPIRFIRSALPDSNYDGYSINNVYGMCESAWDAEVKKIHLPKSYDK